VRALRRRSKAARIKSGKLFRSVNRGRVAERGLHKDSTGAILEGRTARKDEDEANRGPQSSRRLHDLGGR